MYFMKMLANNTYLKKIRLQILRNLDKRASIPNLQKL